MNFENFRIPLAFVVLAAWLALTLSGNVLLHAAEIELPVDLQTGISPNLAMASGLLLVVIVLFGWWKEMRLNPPRSANSLAILWVPLIYLALFWAFGAFMGFPPASVFVFLGINALFVGWSEEMMFRGVMFQALRTRLNLWPAIWLTSIVFGSVHVLNGFGTGDFVASSIQAVAAGMSGLFFLAVMLRTGSIIPAMLLHAFWDYSLLITTGQHLSSGGTPTSELPFLLLLAPILFVLPQFAYGLFLLRKATDKPQAIPAAAV